MANETAFEFIELHRLAAELGLARVMDELDASIVDALRHRLDDLDHWESELDNRFERFVFAGFISSIRAGNADAVELFVRTGANPNEVCYPPFMDGDDSALGITLYFWQARAPAVIGRLLALGADPERAYDDVVGFLARPEEEEDNEDFMPDASDPSNDAVVPVDALCHFFLRGSPESFLSILPYARRPDRLLALLDEHPLLGLHREQKTAALEKLRGIRFLVREAATTGKKRAHRREHAYLMVLASKTPLPYDARNRIVDYLCD